MIFSVRVFVCYRHLYSLEYGRELDSHYAHDDAISSMLLTPDKTTLVTASWDDRQGVALSAQPAQHALSHQSSGKPPPKVFSA